MVTVILRLLFVGRLAFTVADSASRQPFLQQTTYDPAQCLSALSISAHFSAIRRSYFQSCAYIIAAALL